MHASFLTADWICERYHAVNARLPAKSAEGAAISVDGIAQLADRFDAVLLDAFGVLNVGTLPIPGAPEAVAALQNLGIAVLVLTNGATQTAADALAKYRSWGYDFEFEDVVASRDLVEAALLERPADMLWGVAAPAVASVHDWPQRTQRLDIERAPYDSVDGFVLLSTHDWSEQKQALLHDSLKARPRPVLVANPDVAAPRENGFSLEPGHFGHLVADLPGVESAFFGKPFGNAFDEAFARLRARGLVVEDKKRVAMVGDSLHTDILGGAAAGCTTILVTDHGLFRGVDYEAAIARYGISPDFVIPGL